MEGSINKNLYFLQWTFPCGILITNFKEHYSPCQSKRHLFRRCKKRGGKNKHQNLPQKYFFWNDLLIKLVNLLVFQQYSVNNQVKQIIKILNVGSDFEICQMSEYGYINLRIAHIVKNLLHFASFKTLHKSLMTFLLSHNSSLN